MIKKTLRFFWDNLIAGIAVILPIAVTWFIFMFLANMVNSVMLNPLIAKLSAYSPYEEQRVILAKTAIFVCVVSIIMFIGLMTRVIIVRRTFSFFERVLLKLPMVNKIYGATREISNAFLGNKKSSFQKVVLIEYPRKGVYTLGFVTSEAKGALQETISGGDLMSIYVPTTPNPTSGLFVMMKKDDVMQLDISVEDALKAVISAGAINPPHKNKNVSDV